MGLASIALSASFTGVLQWDDAPRSCSQRRDSPSGGAVSAALRSTSIDTALDIVLVGKVGQREVHNNELGGLQTDLDSTYTL
jgi:hypothetical protein